MYGIALKKHGGGGVVVLSDSRYPRLWQYEWNSSILVGHSDSNTTLLCPALDCGDMYGIALYCKETRWFWYGGGCGVGTFG